MLKYLKKNLDRATIGGDMIIPNKESQGQNKVDDILSAR
jgi:hypothetical protein